MKPSEVVTREVEGVRQNLDALGTPKFYQFKKHRAIRYWKGQHDAIARENIGRYIDVKKRIGGYYPKQIIEYPDGRLALKDPQGVCSPIEDTEFNVVHYDYFVQKDEFMEVGK